jgi:hypothetical protein
MHELDINHIKSQTMRDPIFITILPTHLGGVAETKYFAF